MLAIIELYCNCSSVVMYCTVTVSVSKVLYCNCSNTELYCNSNCGSKVQSSNVSLLALTVTLAGVRARHCALHCCAVCAVRSGQCTLRNVHCAMCIGNLYVAECSMQCAV